MAHVKEVDGRRRSRQVHPKRLGEPINKNTVCLAPNLRRIPLLLRREGEAQLAVGPRRICGGQGKALAIHRDVEPRGGAALEEAAALELLRCIATLGPANELVGFRTVECLPVQWLLAPSDPKNFLV